MKIIHVYCLLAAAASIPTITSETRARTIGQPLRIRGLWVSPPTRNQTSRINIYFRNAGHGSIREIVVALRPDEGRVLKFTYPSAVNAGRFGFLSGSTRTPTRPRNLRIVSIQYKSGRRTFSVRGRNALRRALEIPRKDRRGIFVGAQQPDVLLLSPGPRMNFARAQAACRTANGRLPGLTEVRRAFKGGRLRFRAGAKANAAKVRRPGFIWTATNYHDSGQAGWQFDPIRGFARGAFYHRRGQAACVFADQSKTRSTRN